MQNRDFEIDFELNAEAEFLNTDEMCLKIQHSEKPAVR